MAERSAKLARQLHKYLELPDAEAKLVSLGRGFDCSGKEHSEALRALGFLPAFLDAVDAAYRTYDDNLAMANRSLSVSSRELNSLNLSMRTLLDGLGEAFLIFGRDGMCQPTFSKACLTLLEGAPSGRHIADVLKLQGETREHFMLWLDMVFSRDHAVTLEELLAMCPKDFDHSAGLVVKLSYRPILDALGYPEAFVMIAADYTAAFEAEEEVAHERAFMEALLPVARDRDTFRTFLRQFREVVAYAGQELVDPSVLKRDVHTLKGMAAMFHLQELVEALHEAESALGRTLLSVKQRLAVLKPVEYEVDSFLARFKDVLGESIEHSSAVRHVYVDKLDEFNQFLVRLGMPIDVIRAYREMLLSIPVNRCLANVDNYVQALAARLNKAVLPVIYEGDNPPVVESLYASFFTSLIHMWRNMLDHGIEAPSIREGAGKRPEGQIVIRVNVEREANGKEWLCFTFMDDGAGIDPQRVRKKLMDTDPQRDWSALSDDDVLQRIFQAGVSTAQQITHYSGRGVGLDAVMSEVSMRGGRAEVRSVLGQGSMFVIYLPYVWE